MDCNYFIKTDSLFFNGYKNEYVKSGDCATFNETEKVSYSSIQHCLLDIFNLASNYPDNTFQMLFNDKVLFYCGMKNK